jgi:hypothetical protein
MHLLSCWITIGLAAMFTMLGGVVHAQAPRRLYSPDDLAAMRAKFENPTFAPYREMLLENGDNLMLYKGENTYWDELSQVNLKGRAYKLRAQRLQPVVMTLPWCYVMTGDTAYKDALVDVLRFEMKERQPFDAKRYQEEFKLVQVGVHAAIIYDLLRDELEPDDLAMLRAYLDDAIKLFFDARDRGGTWGFNNNIGAVFFGAAGIIALSRLDDHPRAQEVLDEAIKGLNAGFVAKMIQPHPDGAYQEGALYWQFGCTWHIAFAEAYRRVTGRDSGQLDHPFYANNRRFVETMLGGDGYMIPFADAQPQLYGSAVMAYLGAKQDDALFRWLADRVLSSRHEDVAYRLGSRDVIYYLLAMQWRDTTPAPSAFPGVPTLAMLESLQWGTVRSDGAMSPALQLSVKGNPAKGLAHNTQADAGTFVVYARGQAFVIDPGYYQPDAAAHSLAVIDGQGPEAKTAKAAPLQGWERGEHRGLTVDATLPYLPRGASGPTPRRVARHFVLLADAAVVVLDDFVAGDGAPGHVVSRFQLGFPAELSPTGAVVRGESHDLTVTCHGPEPALQLSGPNDWGRSWIFKRRQVAWHTLEAAYTLDASRPMVTVMVPTDRGQAAATPRVRHDPDAVHVTLGEHDVKFVKHDTGWRAAGD